MRALNSPGEDGGEDRTGRGGRDPEVERRDVRRKGKENDKSEREMAAMFGVGARQRDPGRQGGRGER